MFHFLKESSCLFFQPGSVWWFRLWQHGTGPFRQCRTQPACRQLVKVEHWETAFLKHRWPQRNWMVTRRQVAEARGRNWLSVFFVSMEKQLLSLVLTSSHSVLTGGHHSDGTRGSSSPQSSLQEPFRHVSNRPSAQSPSYLPGTFELKSCRVIFPPCLMSTL